MGAAVSSAANLGLSGSDISVEIACSDAVTNGATHNHAYENTSGFDAGTEYYMVASKFRIYLHDDFMNSVDLNTLECTSPSSWETCDGGSSPDYGGVEMSFVQGDTSPDAVFPNYVEWDYGTTDPTGKPFVEGRNDYNGDGVVDTAPINRTMGEAVYFRFLDDTPGASGDATTTSALYVQFWAFDQACGNFGDASCWEAVEEDGATNVHWNNHTVEINTNYECPPTDEPVCQDLQIIPSNLSVDDLFGPIDLEVIATDTTGQVMTNVDYHYEAFRFGTDPLNPLVVPNALGRFRYGPFNSQGGSNDEVTMDSTVKYRNGQPGDQILVNVVGPGDCYQMLELPFCADLNFLNPPNSSITVTGNEYSVGLQVEATASNGEAWPYDVEYTSTDASSTFDGSSTQPHEAGVNDTVDYIGQETGFVTVNAQNDVAGLCSDQFFYIVEPEEDDELFCDSLEILTPISPVASGDMESGITLTWESFLTDGSVAPGPWNVISTNPSGEFFDSVTGASLGTGRVLDHTSNTIDYVGTSGDEIFVNDALYGECEDQITSLPLEVLPVCTDLTLGEPTGLDTNETCFDFSVDVSDPSFISTLQAIGYKDNTATARSLTALLTMEVNETGDSTSGNPSLLPLNAGLSTYTGTVCWTNFEAGNYLEISVLGSEEACFESFEFPETVPVCVDLKLEPNVVIIPTGDTESGRVQLGVKTQGSDSSWSGDLIIEDTSGTCELTYADGSPSEFSDGHLQIPVSGIFDSATAYADNCATEENIRAFVSGAEGVCEDEFRFVPEDEGLFCIDLAFNPDELNVPDGGTATTLLELNSELIDQTLVVEFNGCPAGQIRNDGNTYTNRMERLITGSETLLLTFTNMCEDAEITAFVEGQEATCSDELDINVPIEEPVCRDLSFEPDDVQVIETEDKTVSLNLDSDLEDQTLIIEYKNCPASSIEVNGVSFEDRAEILLDGSESLDVTFTNLCKEAEIRTYVEGQEGVCEDTLDMDFVELGEFNKFIFTFNFAVEKDNFSDDGIFFSHDEDRAFYTLEYQPTGDENSITFTDDMWDNALNGRLGSGEDSGGYVQLADSYQELTQSDVDPGNVYEYNTITHFGFGEQHELNSTEVFNYVDRNYTPSNFESFVAYIKYDDNRESEVIEECGDRIGSDICYDQNTRPESTGSLTIHNSGNIAEAASIRVRYVGIVVSGLDCGNSSDECLTEEFQNKAELKVYSGIHSLEAEAKLVVLCSYLVTRNAGDVYLEVALEGGSDVACIFVDEDEAKSAEYRNVDALIILEANPDAYKDINFTPASGADLETGYSGSTVSICDDNEYKDNLIGNLSSYVCEIVSSVSAIWQSSIVESTTETQVAQSIRNAETNQSLNVFKDWNTLKSQLSNQNNPNSGILYFDGSKSDSITLGAITVPEGAWTLIVENADLIIDSNIQYADSSNFRNLPSIAFIVLGGDIHIDNDALNLVGVYYTDQSFTGDERSAVNEPLEIHGSIYGHVQPLLDAAKYVGSPRLDEGGVQVYYDQRIILNTPPGLSEYADISTEEAVNTVDRSGS